MKYEYIKISKLRLLLLEMEFDYEVLSNLPDVEYRQDYQCYFLLKGSKTHTWLAMRHPELFSSAISYADYT